VSNLAKALEFKLEITKRIRIKKNKENRRPTKDKMNFLLLQAIASNVTFSKLNALNFLTYTKQLF